MATLFLIDNPGGELGKLELDLLDCAIHTVPCVASALEFAQTITPDVIICADPLPGLDALDLLELKASEPNLRETGIAIISHGNDVKAECYKKGCDEFIESETDPEELICRIKALLRRSERGGLHGLFEDVSFVDVVQMLMSSQRDGIMSIDGVLREGKPVEARVYFKEGHVIHAFANEETGESAFLTLMRATRRGGHFSFQTSEDFTIVPTIEKRTDHLLLSFATKLDEE